MAIVSNNIIGRTAGAVADTVFYTRYGKNILRSQNPSPADARTPIQLELRNKLSDVSSLYSTYFTNFNELLKNFKRRITPCDSFTLRNFYNVIKVDDFYVVPMLLNIDISNVQLLKLIHYRIEMKYTHQVYIEFDEFPQKLLLYNRYIMYFLIINIETGQYTFNKFSDAVSVLYSDRFFASNNIDPSWRNIIAFFIFSTTDYKYTSQTITFHHIF